MITLFLSGSDIYLLCKFLFLLCSMEACVVLYLLCPLINIACMLFIYSVYIYFYLLNKSLNREIQWLSPKDSHAIFFRRSFYEKYYKNYTPSYEKSIDWFLS